MKILGEFQPVAAVFIRKVVAFFINLAESLISVPRIGITELSKASLISGILRIFYN